MKNFFVTLVVAAFSFAALSSCSGSDTKKTSKASIKDIKTGTEAIVKVNACDVLKESVAQDILGAAATKSDVDAGNASNDDISVSNCVYTAEIVPGAVKANNTKGVAILVRSAKTLVGVKSNQSVFDQKPSDAQGVSGLGDEAFFNPNFRQLNVRKGGNWYIVTSYTGSPGTATLADDKALAEKLSFK